MKELSIEEKAKRYDEAVINGSRLWECGEITRENYEYIFPELKESEDERIRQMIINTLNRDEILTEDETYDCLAWLEKQSQVHCTGVGKKEETGVLKKMYDLENEMKTPEESLGIDSDTYNKIVDECIYGKQNPAWGEEDEVKINRIVACLENLNVADNDILLKDVDWLKSLKGKIQPQPKQEWSEEDKSRMDNMCHFLEEYGDQYYGGLTLKGTINWLKSLRPLNTWKPSDEQLHYLSWIANIKLGDSVVEQEVSKHLNELYTDLKKLKE